jgi:prolyl oligopeptidase
MTRPEALAFLFCGSYYLPFLMKNLTILLALLAAGPAGAQTLAASKPLPYPSTRKVDTVTTYFGTKVADPYRWL